MSINGGLERQLSGPMDKQGLLKLQKYLQNSKLDPELSSMVIQLCEDYERLEMQLDMILSKETVDFRDLEELEATDVSLRQS